MEGFQIDRLVFSRTINDNCVFWNLRNHDLRKLLKLVFPNSVETQLPFAHND